MDILGTIYQSKSTNLNVVNQLPIMRSNLTVGMLVRNFTMVFWKHGFNLVPGFILAFSTFLTGFVLQ